MKTWITGLMLTTLIGSAWAQPGTLTNATVSDRASISDPAMAVNEVSNGWLAIRMPVIEGTRSPCCWQGNWNSNREVGCSLQTDRRSHGTRRDSPLAQNVIAYARVSGGIVKTLRIVGEDCPVDGGGAEVTWIGVTDDTTSLEWLDSVARSTGHGASEAALYATALHASPAATKTLHALVTDEDSGLSEEAVFWLGEARGVSGYRALGALLDELPHGDTRQHINFALAQNDSSEAFALLVEISRTDADPEQRGNALFWLAEEYPEQAENLLLETLAGEKGEEVLEQAIFAVSQLPQSQATRILLDLAQDPEQPRETRRQAMFWLAHSDDDEALAALEELLTR
jgi:HEAT repeat protein